MNETQKQQLAGCRLTYENTALICKAHHSYCPSECPLRMPTISFVMKHMYTENMNKEHDELCSGHLAKDRLVAGIDTV